MKTCLSLILILIFNFSTSGQVKATTESGRKVILNSNGTWQYAPQPDKNEPAIVYIYRLKEGGIYNRAREISLSGKEILDIKQGDFVGIKLPPGKYPIRTNKDDSEITIEVVAGERYFVLLVVSPGGLTQTHVLQEVPESQAVLQLKKTSIIDDKQIKSKDLILVKENPALK